MNCITMFYVVHGKTTYDEWHTDDIRVHTSEIQMTYEWHTDDIQIHRIGIRMTYDWHTDDIRVTYEYIGVTYKWHTSTYNWHTNGIRVHKDKIWAHTSDIRMAFEYIRVAYELHTCDIQVHTIDIQMACKWHANFRSYKGFGTFRSHFSALFQQKHCTNKISKILTLKLTADLMQA